MSFDSKQLTKLATLKTLVLVDLNWFLYSEQVCSDPELIFTKPLALTLRSFFRNLPSFNFVFLPVQRYTPETYPRPQRIAASKPCDLVKATYFQLSFSHLTTAAISARLKFLNCCLAFRKLY